MASRSHTTFKKRQKEQARLEKRRDKAAKMQQRKLEKRPFGLDDEAGISATDSPSDPGETDVAAVDTPQ